MCCALGSGGKGLVYVQGRDMCCALGSGGKGLVYVQGRDMCCALRVRYNKLW
jgi:hypothetical protein